MLTIRLVLFVGVNFVYFVVRFNQSLSLFTSRMQQEIKKILIRYWGYTHFRSLQEEIILSVLNGQDTLALMPTGGGKSLCFQVPAMAQEGLCLVVSPLIALMKDQVEKLRHKGIPAAAVFSGMKFREIEMVLNNCIHGNIKFLYLSPERLNTDMVLQRLPHMKISLLAVDEAHCVSQWGYDFRPSYLKTADVRKHLPGTPVLALTASATPEVQQDIMEKLLFRKKNILQKSFERKNLAYVVLHEEDKAAKTLRIIQKVKGQGILYVRNRRKTRELSDLLNRHGISAAFYHAGLDMVARHQVQDAWMKNRIRVIVATNAFGMGIDKSDVRFVIHEDVPECLEAYYQEAGRAGRDEKKAYAILLYNRHDRLELERQAEISFPETADIKRVYQALANYYQLPVGSGAGVNFDFDLAKLCKTYELPIQTAFSCLKVLELQGLISTTDSIELYSRIRILIHRDTLYEFQVKHEKYDHLIKVLLRSYEGLFDDYVGVKESEVARRAELDEATVTSMLESLHKSKILDYVKATNSPQLTFLTERLDVRDLRIDRQHLVFRKERHQERLKAMLTYAEKKTRCRNQMLLHYFGEEINHRCGTCDFCLRRNRLGLSDLEFSEVHAQVKNLLAAEPLPLTQLIESVQHQKEDKTIRVVEWLIDNQKIAYEGNLLRWNDQ